MAYMVQMVGYILVVGQRGMLAGTWRRVCNGGLKDGYSGNSNG